MKNIQKILSLARQAIEKYEMIQRGDKIAVGVSGGKDSLVLLKILSELKRFDDFSFELIALTIDLGFQNASSLNIPPVDYSKITKFCKEIGIEHIIAKARIAEIVFDKRKEENPCGLCARLRRGALNNEIEKIGFNTLALGHHLDDVCETFMMNLIFQGRIGCFSPTTYYNDNLKMIRPLVYTRERDVASLARRLELPSLQKFCPADGVTQRSSIKNMINDLESEHRKIYSRILGALERGEIDGWKIK